MQYNRGSKNITLTIEPDNYPQWWMASPYALHPHMKSHTGIFMTTGKGPMYRSSCKQKLICSTKATLVRKHDAMGQIS